MKKIIVFGATGHVGSYFVKYAQNYFDITKYQIIASGKRENADVFQEMGVPYISVDITRQDDFEKLPKQDVYAAVLLAAVIPAYMDGYQPEKYLSSIIGGTFNVLEYCRKINVEKILYSTSCFDVFEYPSGTIIKPDMPLNFKYTGDHAVYVISKNTAIELLKHYHQQYGLKTFVFRLPTVYSYSPNYFYYPNGVKTMRPVYKMIFNAIHSKPIEVWGDPSYSKDMLHVYDLSQMFCKAIENTSLSNGFYNCGTGISVSLLEEIKTIIDVFSPKDNPSTLVFCKEKKVGGGILFDIQNAKDELGYEPQYDCKKLFLNFREEMQINRFAALRN